jgi:hypothetical protein
MLSSLSTLAGPGHYEVKSGLSDRHTRFAHYSPKSDLDWAILVGYFPMFIRTAGFLSCVVHRDQNASRCPGPGEYPNVIPKSTVVSWDFAVCLSRSILTTASQAKIGFAKGNPVSELDLKLRHAKETPGAGTYFDSIAYKSNAPAFQMKCYNTPNEDERQVVTATVPTGVCFLHTHVLYLRFCTPEALLALGTTIQASATGCRSRQCAKICRPVCAKIAHSRRGYLLRVLGSLTPMVTKAWN